MICTSMDFVKEVQRICPLSHLQDGKDGPVLLGKLWDNRQRQSHPIHEFPFRGSFQGTLPEFFIERLTVPLARVYDPFMGRGTTLIQAAIMGRKPAGNDMLPLAHTVTQARLRPILPTRLGNLEFILNVLLDTHMMERLPKELDGVPITDLLEFYHERTLRQLLTLRPWLIGEEDPHIPSIDWDNWRWYAEWALMVILSRMTGHSNGYFSGYTLPPNTGVKASRQRTLNKKAGPRPFKQVVPRIVDKSKDLLRKLTSPDWDRIRFVEPFTKLNMASCTLPWLEDGSVDLLITSPPFLGCIDYAEENWLKNWYLGRPKPKYPSHGKPETWIRLMHKAMGTWYKALKPGAYAIIEAGEHKGVNLNEVITTIGKNIGYEPVCTLIQTNFNFSKTAQIYLNPGDGTNSQRVAVLRRG